MRVGKIKLYFSPSPKKYFGYPGKSSISLPLEKILSLLPTFNENGFEEVRNIFKSHKNMSMIP